MTSPSPLLKPGMVTAIAIMTLVSGIINIIYSLGITGSVVLGTFGFGLLCAPVTLLPLVLGVFEILYAAKLLSEPPRPVQPSQTIAILEILNVLTGNVLSLVVGILALVFYNDPQVQGYFARLNARPPRADAVVSLPAEPQEPSQPSRPRRSRRKKSSDSPS